MEVEAKYRIEGRVRAAEVEALDFAPYRLGPRVVRRLHDTLLDTDALTLLRLRYALRVRHDGDDHVLTLKSPSTLVGDTHQRQEWEAILHDDPFLPASWPDHLRRRVQSLVGEAVVRPVMILRNHRRTWDLFLDGERVAELALDNGTIRAGKAQAPMHEIEVEAKEEGTMSDLAAIVAILTAHLPLVVEPRSKSERGMALLTHRG